MCSSMCIIYGGFLSHGVPQIIHFCLGFSMKQPIQPLGYRQLWKQLRFFTTCRARWLKAADRSWPHGWDGKK